MSTKIDTLQKEIADLRMTIRRLEAMKTPVVTISGLPDDLTVKQVTCWPHRPEVHIDLGSKE